MRDEKEERSKVKQTNKAKQHSTPKAVTSCTSTISSLTSSESTLTFGIKREREIHVNREVTSNPHRLLCTHNDMNVEPPIQMYIHCIMYTNIPFILHDIV